MSTNANPNAIPETVRIAADKTDDNPLGYVVINKSDLTDEHKLFEESKTPVLDAAAAAILNKADK